jgi:hypothetical protein
MSSGASQRCEPPPVVFETEYISSAIEERPKSARHGFPAAVMRILCWRCRSERVMVNGKIGRDRTNTLQVTVNNLVGMQVVKATDDAE